VIRARERKLLPAVLLLLFLCLTLGMTVGGVHLSFSDLWSGQGQGGETARLLASLRFPRVALAAIVGGCLALAGAALQALLKNPLADPFLLGTSGGAATGAALAALAGLSPLLSPAAAFAGAVLASFGVAALARRRGRLDLQRLLLAGLIANAFFSALLLLVFSVASGEAARTMLFWMMGSLSDATAGKAAALLPYAAAAGAVLLLSASRLNLFAVGEENAAALGVDTERSKRIVFLAASLLTGPPSRSPASSVSSACSCPTRRGPSRAVSGCSCLSPALRRGAARGGGWAAFRAGGAPIGAVTAAIGAPLFAWLLLRSG
jgi:iron complex transport system permease protein